MLSVPSIAQPWLYMRKDDENRDIRFGVNHGERAYLEAEANLAPVIFSYCNSTPILQVAFTFEKHRFRSRYIVNKQIFSMHLSQEFNVTVLNHSQPCAGR
jgi:hypothetical protein